MKREIILKHEFVEYIPDDLKDGTIYVSIAFAIAAHKCCCGCGNEVITPISPIDWQLTFDGESISLYPSIGNWNFDCKSHYWITHNKVRWARRWLQQEIETERIYDRLAKEKYFGNTKTSANTSTSTAASTKNDRKGKAKKSLRWNLKKRSARE